MIEEKLLDKNKVYSFPDLIDNKIVELNLDLDNLIFTIPNGRKINHFYRYQFIEEYREWSTVPGINYDTISTLERKINKIKNKISKSNLKINDKSVTFNDVLNHKFSGIFYINDKQFKSKNLSSTIISYLDSDINIYIFKNQIDYKIFKSNLKINNEIINKNLYNFYNTYGIFELKDNFYFKKNLQYAINDYIDTDENLIMYPNIYLYQYLIEKWNIKNK